MASPVTSLATGLSVHRPASAEALAAVLRECWSGPRADLFDFDLAVVPGPGFQRWLSQQWATADGMYSASYVDMRALIGGATHV